MNDAAAGRTDDGASVSDYNGLRIVVAGWALVTIAAGFMGARFYCKTRRHRCLWIDDYTLLVSWICLLVDISLGTAAVSFGFGTHLSLLLETSPSNATAIGHLTTLAGTFAILAAVLSKSSFILTMVRLTDTKMRRFLWVILVSMNVLMVTSAIVLYVQCTPAEKVWSPAVPGRCWPLIAGIIISEVASAYSGIADVMLSILPWVILWKLRIGKMERIGTSIAMSMGIFAGLTAFVKCYYLTNLNGGDFTYDGTSLVIWAAAESAAAITAASIPMLRTLIRDFSPSSHGRWNNGMTLEHIDTANFATPVHIQSMPKAVIKRDDGSDTSILPHSPRGDKKSIANMQSQDIALRNLACEEAGWDG